MGLYDAWAAGDLEAAAGFASTDVVEQLLAVEVKPPAGSPIALGEPDCIYFNVDEYVDVIFEGESQGGVSAIAAVGIEVVPEDEAGDVATRFEAAQDGGDDPGGTGLPPE